MTGTEKQTVLTQVRELAGKLLSALEDEDYGTASELAEAIQTVGIQSLDRLMPRGTLEFPAGNRWGDLLTSELLAHLKQDLPEQLTAQLLAVLGYWAGEVAVPAIRQLLIERARRSPSVETARTIRSGFHALHMIGGSRAVQTLCEFQREEFPEKVREDAAWFLNELGGRIEDPLFGSEKPPESAEEVHLRDSLEDPYCWRCAAERLRDSLFSIGRRYLDKYPDAPKSVLPAKEADTVFSAFVRGSSTPWEGELLDVLEPIVPQFMIRWAPSELLVFSPVMCFFPNTDVVGHNDMRSPKEWSILGLLAGSTSVIYLNQLQLFEPGDLDGTGDEQVRSVLRDWLSVPLRIAQLFGRRRHYPLVFSMAAFQHHTQSELAFGRVLSFPDLLRSMFRGVSTPQSESPG